MSYTKRIAYNTVVQILARLVTTVISIVAIGILTRYLGVTGYGQFTLIISYLSLLGVLVDFGFFLLQIRELTQHPERESDIMGNVLGLKIVLSLIVFSLGYLVARFIYPDTVTTNGILIGSISQAFLSFQHVPNAYFQTHLRMQVAAVVNVVARVMYVALLVWAVGQNMGILGAVIVTSIVNVTIFILQWIVVARDHILWPRWNFTYWKYFILQAFPLGVVMVLSMVYFRLDSVLLSILKDAYAVGIYGPPYKVIEVLLTFPTIFMSSVFPVLTTALNDNFEKAQEIFRRAFDFTSLVAFPIGFGTMAVATPIMVLITRSTDFAPSGPVLAIIIWACVLSFFGAVFNYAVVAKGQQRILVYPYLAATLFNIVANIFVIPKYSYIGASYVTVLTELLVLIWVAWLAWKYCKFLPHFGIFFRSAAAAAVMWAVLVGLHPFSLFVTVPAAMVIYVAAAFLFRAVPPGLIQKVLRR